MMSDLVGRIMDYETNAMTSGDEILMLFADLVASGMAWTLQGSYGRTASALIDQGYISDSGEILRWPEVE